jgi:hypothetical protein
MNSTQNTSANTAINSGLQVLLAAFYDGESAMVPSKFEWVSVSSLEDASEKVRTFIDANDCGARDWFGGIVRDETKVPVSVIQFNGRIDTVEENTAFIQNAKDLLSK